MFWTWAYIVHPGLLTPPMQPQYLDEREILQWSSSAALCCSALCFRLQQIRHLPSLRKCLSQWTVHPRNPHCGPLQPRHQRRPASKVASNVLLKPARSWQKTQSIQSALPPKATRTTKGWKLHSFHVRVSIELCINACEIYVCKWCATKDVQLKGVVPCFEFQLHVLQSCRETFTTSQVVTWQTSQLQIWLVQMCLAKPWKVAGRSPLVKLAWLKSKRLLCFEICEFHGQFKSCVPGLFSSYKRILIKIIGTPQRKTVAANHVADATSFQPRSDAEVSGSLKFGASGSLKFTSLRPFKASQNGEFWREILGASYQATISHCTPCIPCITALRLLPLTSSRCSSSPQVVAHARHVQMVTTNSSNSHLFPETGKNVSLHITSYFISLPSSLSSLKCFEYWDKHRSHHSLLMDLESICHSVSFFLSGQVYQSVYPSFYLSYPILVSSLLFSSLILSLSCLPRLQQSFQLQNDGPPE